MTLAMVAQVRLLTAPSHAIVCALKACHEARIFFPTTAYLPISPLNSSCPTSTAHCQVPLWWCIACPLVLGMLAPFLFK